jgi:hypothetical protein
MTVERIVWAVAGAMVLVSAVLSAAVSPWFLLWTGFVGANMLQSAFTGFCPAAILLRRAGLEQSCTTGKVLFRS